MAFRVLIAGPVYFDNYKSLRAVLDALLAKWLPDVELPTVGGPGVPVLGASYAAERGLPIVAVLPGETYPAARDGSEVWLT